MEIYNESALQIQQEMQAALDAAWATDDPEAKALQEQLFPGGKPTLEQFIEVLARQVREQYR